MSRDRMTWCDGDDKPPTDPEIQVWIRYLAITCPALSEDDRHSTAVRGARTARRVDPLITKHMREDLRFHARAGFLPDEARTPAECRLRNDWQDRGMLPAAQAVA